MPTRRDRIVGRTRFLEAPAGDRLSACWSATALLTTAASRIGWTMRAEDGRVELASCPSHPERRLPHR